MKRLTLLLDDEALYEAVETEARTTGRTVAEIVVQALRQWQADSEPDPGERAELAAARREWAKREASRPAPSSTRSAKRNPASTDEPPRRALSRRASPPSSPPSTGGKIQMGGPPPSGTGNPRPQGSSMGPGGVGPGNRKREVLTWLSSCV